MNYTYIKETPAQLKQVTRSLMKGKWVKAFISVLLAYLVSALPAIIVAAMGIKSNVITVIVSLYQLAVFGLVLVGLAKYFLNLIRGDATEFSDLFVGVNFMGSTLLLGLFIFAILQLISGYLIVAILMIVALLRYSMSFFILVDDPKKRVTRCITESSFLMRINKMQLFRLCLSFLLLFVIAYIPKLAVTTNCIIKQMMLDNPFFFNMEMTTNEAMQYWKENAESIMKSLEPVAQRLVIWQPLLNLPFIAVSAFMAAALAVFYELACGNMRFANQAEAEYYNDANGYQYSPSNNFGADTENPFDDNPTIIDVEAEPDNDTKDDADGSDSL